MSERRAPTIRCRAHPEAPATALEAAAVAAQVQRWWRRWRRRRRQQRLRRRQRGAQPPQARAPRARRDRRQQRCDAAAAGDQRDDTLHRRWWPGGSRCSDGAAQCVGRPAALRGAARGAGAAGILQRPNQSEKVMETKQSNKKDSHDDAAWPDSAARDCAPRGAPPRRTARRLGAGMVRRARSSRPPPRAPPTAAAARRPGSARAAPGSAGRGATVARARVAPGCNLWSLRRRRSTAESRRGTHTAPRRTDTRRRPAHREALVASGAV